MNKIFYIKREFYSLNSISKFKKNLIYKAKHS